MEGRLFNLIFSDFIIKRTAADSQLMSGGFFIPAAFLQNLQQKFALVFHNASIRFQRYGHYTDFGGR